MLKNTIINREVIKSISVALGELNQKVVYVGGAVVSLYIDDPIADDIRPTKDIDITLEIASLHELEGIRELLNKKGFIQSHEDGIMCRFRYNDILVDVMATKAIGWAPGNVWFETGFNQSIETEVDGIFIKILPFQYYLASKFSAFMDRGIEDPLVSKDFEDITYLLNHTPNLKEMILLSSDKKVLDFLKTCFENILNENSLQEIMLGNLFHEDQTKRFDKIMTQIKEIAVAI